MAEEGSSSIVHPLLFHRQGDLLTLGTDLVGEWDARQQKVSSLLQGSQHTLFLNLFYGAVLPNPILLGSPLPSTLSPFLKGLKAEE